MCQVINNYIINNICILYVFRLYLQQVLNNSIGQRVIRDFVKFNWDWITSKQKLCKWGPLTSNLLLIAQEGII